MAYSGPTELYIDDQWMPSRSGKTFATVNPTDGTEITKVSEGDKADIDLAVDAAYRAFPSWRDLPGEARALLLNRLADQVEAQIDEFAALESLDNGLLRSFAPFVFGSAVELLRYYAGYATKLHGQTIPLPDSTLLCYTRREPLGVVGIIVPWNFPFAITIAKVAPALACGNTIVIKPSEKTPLTALKLAELCRTVGFPAGVVNVVPGYGPTAGAALALHKKVAKIAFTGSIPTGQAIAKMAIESNLKKFTLELGGKSPVIVCEDADIDEALEAIHNGMFFHQGQVCAAGTRVFVHEAIYDDFLARSKEMAMERCAAVGDPADNNTLLGPIVDRIQFDKVCGYIEAGKKEGAKLVVGGKPISRPGYFIEPTLFADVKDDMKIAREEIFGPVMCVLKFSTLEEALERANNTPYGLAAGVFTRNAAHCHALAAALEAGTVWVNTYMQLFHSAPFGGYKMSGMGRENGKAAIYDYTQLKTVTMKVAKL